MEENEGGDPGTVHLLIEARRVQTAADVLASATDRDHQGRCSYGESCCLELGGRPEELAPSAAEHRTTEAGDRQHLRPVPTEDLLTQLVQMRKAVTEDSLLRFKSVKKLATEVTAEWIQFQICISLHQERGAIWSTLNQWIGQASWHTLGCRLRHDRPAYDNLVQEVWQHQMQM